MDELNVKVGDKVLLKYSSYCRDCEVIAKVTKITPTGRIRIDKTEKQFDKYGRVMGDRGFGSGYHRICPITEDDIERIKKENFIKRVVILCNKLNEKDISYEKAVKIVKILETE